MCTIRVRIVLWENLSHLTRFPQGPMGQGFELRTAAQASVAERFSSRVAKKEKQHDPSSDCAVGESVPSYEVPTGNDGTGIRTPHRCAS